MWGNWGKRKVKIWKRKTQAWFAVIVAIIVFRIVMATIRIVGIFMHSDIARKMTNHSRILGGGDMKMMTQKAETLLATRQLELELFLIQLQQKHAREKKDARTNLIGSVYLGAVLIVLMVTLLIL